MSHSFLLCSQVSLIVGVRNCFNRYIFHNLQSIGFESYTFHRIICQKFHFMHSQFTKNLSSYSIVTLIRQMSQANIGIHSIHSVFLKFICFHFLHQADTTTFLIQINNHTFSRCIYHFHRFMQLFATVTASGTKDITGSTRRMHTHQDRFVLIPSSLE